MELPLSAKYPRAVPRRRYLQHAGDRSRQRVRQYFSKSQRGILRSL